MEEELDIYKNAEISIRNAQGIYLDHETRVKKALDVGLNMLRLIDEKGMDEDSYNNATNLLKKYALTITNFKEERKVVTEFIQNITKKFTAQENAIDVKKEDTVPFKLYQKVNDYVIRKEKEKAERDRIERMRIQHESDIREAKVDVQTNFDLSFVEFKQSFAKRMQVYLGELTLENQAEIRKKIHDSPYWPLYLENYPMEKRIDIIIGKVQRRTLDKEEFGVIVKEYVESKTFKEKLNDFESYCISEQHECLSRLVSRVRDLEELQRLGEAEKQRIIEQKKREDEDAIRAIEQTARMEAQAVIQNEEEKRELITAQADFDKETVSANVVSDYKAVDGYKVILTLPGGMIPLVRFWVSKQSAPITMEQIETLSFGRLVAFAEKQAKKTGEMIESEFVTYKPIVKAKF